MKRIMLSLFIMLLLNSCFQNIRHKVGFTTKPFAKGDGFESSTKLNYTIIFGVVRPKEDDD